MVQTIRIFRYQIGFFIALLFPIQIYAQCTYTPQGSRVSVAYSMEEFTEAQKLSQKEYIAKQYPKAIYLSEATSTYNCHAYAWRNSSSDVYWLNYEDIFWLDGSYVEVPFYDPKATKISYTSDEHSACCSYGRYVISKWGKLPLVKHQPEDCPYNSKNLRYYKLSMEISGDEIISLPNLNAQATKEYTLSNVPQGATVEWITNGTIINGQGTDKVTISINCDIEIRAKVHCPTGITVDIPAIDVHASAAPIITDITMSKYGDQKGYYILQVITNQPEATYSWEASGGILSDIPFKDDASYAEQPNTFKAILFTSYSCSITVTGINENEWSSTFTTDLFPSEISD